MCIGGHFLLQLFSYYCYFYICVIDIVDDTGDFSTNEYIEELILLYDVKNFQIRYFLKYL